MTTFKVRRNMKNKLFIIGALALLVEIQPVLAFGQQEPIIIPYNQHIGWYGDMRVGTNFLVGPLVTLYHGDYSESGGWAWGADLGYSFTTHFGLEGGFAQSYRSEQQGHLNVPYAAIKLNVPFAQRAAIFFKLGAMYTDTSSLDTDAQSETLPFEGMGLSYAVTNKIDLTVQLQGSFYAVYNLGVASIGMTYHF